jgi:GT2 family glycosyltransferase
MPHPRSLLQIDFDQYHRYAAVAVLLKPLIAAQERTLQHPVRILEVGSFSLNLLPEFLAPLPIEIVRADVLPGLDDGTGPYVEITPGEPYPFDDRAFDYTVALEVLEHIPATDRAFALGEWARLSREAVFFSCPNGKHVERMERRADRDYRQRHGGTAHPWLEEHERFGSPTPREVKTLCEQLQLVCRRFLNSPLAEWLPLLLATEQAWEFGSETLVRRFNEALNERPFRAQVSRPAYRQLYAAFTSVHRARQASLRWTEGRTTARRAVDPVRVLTRTFTRLLTDQEGRRVSAHRLETLDRSCIELQRRLTDAERQVTWQARELAIWRSRRSRWAASWYSLKRRLNRFHRGLLDGAELHGLTPLGPTRWAAETNHPSFIWTGEYAPGWHRITISGQADTGLKAKLYLDYGHGFQDAHAIRLGEWPQGLAIWSTYAYFHHPINRLRLEPVDAVELFTLEHFAIQPVHSGRVVAAGFRRWLTGLLRQPRKLLRARAAKSCLRFWLDLATLPRGEVLPRETPYTSWLNTQRPTPTDRQDLVARIATVTPPLTAVVVLPVQAGDRVVDFERTWSSLAQSDVPPEVWVAVPETRRHEFTHAVHDASMTVRWLPYAPDEPLSRLLHRVVDQTDATLLITVPVGSLLEPDALATFLNEARQHPQAVLFYADEGGWEDGRGYVCPLLKPELTRETLQHQPHLLGAAVAVRASYLRERGFHPAYEGALLPELCLHTLDTGRAVIHIRRVLMHDTTLRAHLYAPRALTHLTNERADQRQGRLTAACLPLVSIIIPSAGRRALLEGQQQTHLARCLASIRDKSRYPQYELLVVDNGQLDEDVQHVLAAHQVKRVTVPGPFNFSRNLNEATRGVKGTHLLFLNDDTEVISPDWIDQLLLYSVQDGVGAVGAKLYFPDGTLQHVGIALSAAGPGHPYYGEPRETPGYLQCCVEPRNWVAVTAACLMTPRAAFEAVGGFDESYELNYNDVDYCLRLGEAGYRCVVNPKAELYHYETIRADGRAPFRPAELVRFQARWRKRYPYDPYFTEEPRWRD